MKLVFHFPKIICACLFAFYIFQSCHVASIFIVKGNSGNGVLQLQDAHGNPADTFYVYPGERIKWVIKTDDVRSILQIDAKNTIANDTIFSKPPHKKLLSRTWKAKVENQSMLVGKISEDYFIKWKTKAKDSVTYDPRIQIK